MEYQTHLLKLLRRDNIQSTLQLSPQAGTGVGHFVSWGVLRACRPIHHTDSARERTILLSSATLRGAESVCMYVCSVRKRQCRAHTIGIAALIRERPCRVIRREQR